MDKAADQNLRTGTHNGHLMVAALKRHRDRPVMFLGETTLTGGEVASRISQYIQAFESLGSRLGSTTSGLRARSRQQDSAARRAPSSLPKNPATRGLRVSPCPTSRGNE